MITPSADNAYQNKLDETLLAQGTAAADDKIDLFLIEADYALKYVNSDYTMDVYGDIGLTPDDTAAMYGYTKDVCTDSNGLLKGLPGKGRPAGLIYRRSIADAVLGTELTPPKYKPSSTAGISLEGSRSGCQDQGYQDGLRL